jgi:carotenoid cleavage dioxygenase-like enzyme
MSGHSATDRSSSQVGCWTLDRETRLDDLPVRGTVPPWLTGTLVRTAPATFEVGDRRYNHGFDGLAMRHQCAFWCAGASCGMMAWLRCPHWMAWPPRLLTTVKQGWSRFEALQHASQPRRRGGLKRCR